MADDTHEELKRIRDRVLARLDAGEGEDGLGLDVRLLINALDQCLERQEQTDESLSDRCHVLTERLELRREELEQANRKLRLAEEKFRSIFENSALGIFRSTRQGRYLDANPALAAIMGYDSVLDLLENVRDLSSEAYVDMGWREEILSGLEPGGSVTVESRYRRRDGAVLTCREHIRSSRDPLTGCEILEGFVENVTEKREYEHRLMQSERRYRALYEGASEAILIQDTQGIIRDVNPAAEKLFGYTPQQMRGNDVRDYIHEDDLRKVPFVLDLVIAGKAVRVQRNFRCSDGSYRPVDISVKLVSDDMVIAMIRDMSENRRMEDVLIRAKVEAENANQAKSEFLANMSHEIRTPLSGILGMTEMVLAMGLPGKQLDYVENIRSSAHSLMYIINDILDFSKIEARKLELSCQDFNLRELLARLEKEFGLEAEKKGLKLIFPAMQELPRDLHGDPDRLAQVLRNLLSNALKFTDYGSVSVSLKTRDMPEDRVELEFAVRDTGVGFSGDQASLLFQSFSQLDSTGSKRHSGTGLGLAISKNLVEMMSGSIWAESGVGRGSTFSFKVVLDRARVAAPEEVEDVPGHPVPDAASSVAGLSILVAEDNLINQEFIGFFLREAGHKVTMVEDGEEAVEAARSRSFDLVLMDVQMPRMDGLEATRKIRLEGLDLPVIALTAYAMKGDRERMLEAGMDDYLTKPVDMHALFTALERCVNKKQSGRS